MQPRLKFQFSLRNIMLMMVPLAGASACVGQVAHERHWIGPAIVAVIVALPAAVGALAGGGPGMTTGLFMGLTFLVLLPILLFVIAIIVLMVIGAVSYVVEAIGYFVQ